MDYFNVYDIITGRLSIAQLWKQFPLGVVTSETLYWRGLSGMVLGLEGHILLLLAGDGSRCCKGGKDATVFDGMVFSFFVGV